MSQPRAAIVIGSTGLIGSLLLSKLSHFDTVKAISRKPINSVPANVQNIIVDFSNSESLDASLVGSDLFFCLGTTLRAAGSKEKFTEIEWGLSKKILETAAKNKVENLYLISSMGADEKSVVLYSRIKGQIELLAKNLGFKSVNIVRPSLLLGGRSETRIAEGFAQALLRPLGFMFVGPLLKYRAIEADVVARRLSELSVNPKLGSFVFENDQLIKGFNL